MSFQSIRRATSASLTILLAVVGLSVGVASSASAAEAEFTFDSLFTNDKSLALNEETVNMTAVVGESATQSLTLTATHDLTLESTYEYLTPGESYYVTRAGVCPEPYSSIAMNKGDSCTLTITFTPKNAGTYFDLPSFRAQANGQSVDLWLQLEGTGVAVVLEGQKDFGDVAVDEITTQRLAYRNVTGFDFTFTTPYSFIGKHDELTVTDTTCEGILRPGASCSLDVQFAPSALEASMTTIYATGTMNDTITWSTPAEITGNGVERKLGLLGSPSVEFGSVEQGSTANSSMTLQNTGNVSLSIDAGTREFANASGDFAIAKDLPASLSPGESVEIPMTFSAAKDLLGEQLSELSVSALDSKNVETTATVTLRSIVVPEASAA